MRFLLSIRRVRQLPAASFAACLTLLLSDCGSSSPLTSNATGDAPPASTLSTGHLEGGSGPAPGAIAGVRYESTAASGYTDAEGTFLYQPGTPVRFSIGKVSLGTVPGADLVTPFSFNGGCGMSAGLRLLLRFLYGLDVDGNPGNGLRIPAVAPAQNLADFASFSADQLDAEAQAIGGSGHGLADEVTAVNDFITLVDSESWQQTGLNDLGLVRGQFATQGVTSDGKDWIFSYDMGFMRLGDDYNLIALEPFAIPPALSAQGSNHIGDIDYYDGKIYAPIEDGPGYLAPYVVLYNAPTMLYTGTDYLMPQALQTEGIPWLAVDGPRGYLYTAEWNFATQLNVFDLNHGMTPLHALPLSQVMDRVQGAKVYQGMLYAQEDVFTDKAVYKVNLETGTVIKLFSQAPNGTGSYGEFEGLVMRDLPDGTSMHTLDVFSNRHGVYFRHFTRTVAPLRQSFCPQAGN